MLPLVSLLTGGGVIWVKGRITMSVGVNLTACGQMHHNNEYVVALGHEIFDAYPGVNITNPNNCNNPICNKTLQATYQEKSS
ncbi:hypothetical protein H2248_000138 [Termitomyces sp. 'cryptogamus']|nr:hypothetical protein H2248_000138 [Termitomyces sp. 'cryptogamus']